jgi:CRISPR-associated protein Csx10
VEELSKYIIFNIKAIENLKIGRFERDLNNESSNNYITGSAIRGALIWKWVQKFKEPISEWFNGDIKVYNAYPLIEDQMTIPMFSCFGGEKRLMKDSLQNKKVKNFLYSSKSENEIPYRGGKYILLEGDKGIPYTPVMVYKLHISKKSNSKNNDPKMFRYEAIAKDQSYRAAIQVPDDLVVKVQEILENESFYFGGSRGSGYGKCELTNLKVQNTLDGYSMKEVLSDNDSPKEKQALFVYFMTDGILYYNGENHTSIPTEVLKDKLDIKGTLKLDKSFIDIKTATTYNSLYKTNTVCYSAVTKGSVLKYEVNENINEKLVSKLESDGIGLRREEGFGLIKVLKSLPREINIEAFIDTNPKFEDKAISLNIEDENLINHIAKSVYTNRKELAIQGMLLNIAKNSETSLKNFPSSQINRLSEIFRSTKDSKVKLKTYLNHMSEKKGFIAWNKLGKVKIQYIDINESNTSIQELLRDYVNNKENPVLVQCRKLIKPVNIGNYSYPNKDSQFDNSEIDYVFIFDLLYLVSRLKGDRI